MIYFNKLAHFLLLGFFLFTPHLAIFGFTVKTIYILFLIAIFSLLFKRSIDTKLFILVSFMALLLCISLILNQTISLEVVRQVFIFTILFLVYEFIIGSQSENFLNSSRLVSYIKIWLFLQSLVIIASALIEGFADSFHSFFLLSEKAERYIGTEVLVNRYAGFTPSGFSLLSVYMALLAIFINESTKKRKRSVSHFLFIFVVLIALVFVGRSGLYFFLLYLFLSGNIFRIRSLAFITAASLLAFIISPNISFDLFNYFDFAFELFINGFSSNSIETLANNEIFVPEPSFFGSGNLVRAEGGADSDIGWIKLITCFGYLGVLIYFSLFFYVFSNGLNARSLTSPIFLYLMAALVVFNFKDLYLLSSGYIQVFIIMYFMHRNSYRHNYD
jgi:hypothetical protein